jgi:hypothetical protein
MRLFGTYRQIARATNRVLIRVFAVMAILVLVFLVLLLVRVLTQR